MRDPHLPAAPGPRVCNVFAGLDDASPVERIVSTGQASPPGFRYDQDWAEWVIVLRGAAGLLIEGETEPRALGPRDCLHLAARLRHRVQWTSTTEPTVRLAVHDLP